MDEEKRRKLEQAEAAKRKIEEYQRGLLTEEGRQFMSDMSKNPMTAPPAEVYRDPVDASIRRDPTGIYGFLDRAMRPGRYGTADRMNRQFMEDLPQRRLDALTNQAKMQELQSGQALRELESQALSENPQVSEPAITRLRNYMEVVGQTRPVQQSAEERYNEIIRQAGSGGTPSYNDGQPRPKDRPQATVSPALTDIENMTLTELREKSPSMVASIDDKIAEQQKIIDTGMIEKSVAGPGAYGAGYQYVPPMKVRQEATIAQKEAARVRLEQLQAEKQQVQNKIKRYIPEPSPTSEPKG